MTTTRACASAATHRAPRHPRHPRTWLPPSLDSPPFASSQPLIPCVALQAHGEHAAWRATVRQGIGAKHRREGRRVDAEGGPAQTMRLLPHPQHQEGERPPAALAEHDARPRHPAPQVECPPVVSHVLPCWPCCPSRQDRSSHRLRSLARLLPAQSLVPNPRRPCTSSIPPFHPHRRMALREEGARLKRLCEAARLEHERGYNRHGEYTVGACLSVRDGDWGSPPPPLSLSPSPNHRTVTHTRPLGHPPPLARESPQFPSIKCSRWE
jgi:hypothetical protein